jgi:hypothetical protein
VVNRLVPGHLSPQTILLSNGLQHRCNHAPDIQLLEERMQLSLREKIFVERRSVSRGEEQATRVRARLRNESPNVPDQIQLWRGAHRRKATDE